MITIFMNNNMVLDRKHSTQQAIITLVDKIPTSLDKGDIFLFFCNDHSEDNDKAFNETEHKVVPWNHISRHTT